MGTHEHTEDIILRLSKIEGHVRGIKKMLEEGKSCEEVLIQFSAVKAALNKASKILIEDHFNHCVMGKISDKNLEEELLEFKKALDKFIN